MKFSMLRFYLFLFVFVLSGGIYAQDGIKISGKVVDSNNEPLIGVTVFNVDTKQGAITDIEGKYFITASPTSALRFSYMGYKPQDIKVNNRTTIDVTLEDASEVLDELVVIGYGVVKKKDLTGSTSSLKGSDIVQVPVTTAAQAITGKLAGVSVVTQSGAPGADINILVRGGTSITQGNEPLYIVDGFQTEGALKDIDVNDIESIDVMKDASATAIYGARGSNGVILITTKSGKSGKTQVTYNGFVSFERLGSKLNLLNTEQYVGYQYEYQNLAGKEEQWANMFGGPSHTDPNFYTGAADYIRNTYGGKAGIDWQDLLFGGTALMQNHNVSITGGTDKTKFILSYNNTSQDGIVSKHAYNKNNIRLKLNHEIRKGIRLDFNTNFSNTDIEGGGSLGGMLKLAVLQPVTGGVKFTDDQLINTDVSTEMQLTDSQYDIYNPLITNDAVTQNKYTRVYTMNAGIDIDITKDLTWRTSGSYRWQQIREDYWDDGRTKTAETYLGPWGSRNNDEFYSYQITNTLTWKKSLGLHNITTLLGQEIYYQEKMNLDNVYSEFGENNFGLNNVDMAGTTFSKKSDLSKGRTVSVFGRVMYNYGERYLLTATLRGDGTSKFARGKHWGALPSASAAWRISEESFMKDKTLFDQLKLRVGYGTTGNSDIDNGMYVTSYKGGKYAINNGIENTLVPGNTLANPDLKWEQTTSTNVGLDISILKSRVNLTADFYNQESNNLLLKNKIPASTGYTYQYQNIGSIRNSGVEFVLNTLNVSSKGFTWTTDFNISFNQSKVLELYGNGNNSFLSNVDSRVDFLVEVGKPLGQFYGYLYDGVYTTDDFNQNADGTYTLKNGVARLKGGTVTNIKPGDVKYKPTAGEVDADGNPVWSTADRTVIGNGEPDFTGGITNTLTYKGFDFSFFMNFSYGNQVFNMNTQRFMGPYLPNQNSLEQMSNRFVLIDPATGKETTNLTRLAELNPNQHASDAVWSLHSTNSIATTDALDYYLEDGSFLRLNTVTLGYTLPKKFTQKAWISNARLYATLSNIYTFTKYKGYDPEVSATASSITKGVDSSSYPKAKSFVIGVNLTF
ncbi:MAG: SusC/RagA family TonB-linked outer membrane protein [Dysgonomonas sp.]